MFITHKGKVMKNKRNQKNIIWKILLIIFSIVLIICLIIIGIQKYQQKKQQEYYETLLENAGSQPQATEEVPEPETEEAPDILKSLGIEIPEKDIDFAALQEENSDVYAWIYVPGTNVDYPVLQHPEDDTYYLEHNMDGSKGLPGCIYSESVNTKDFTEPNTVLYGHNMKNGSMFGSLKQYKNDGFYEKNAYFTVFTEDAAYRYQIFTYSDVPEDSDVYTTGYLPDETFDGFLTELLKSSYKDTGVAVGKDDKVLTLSTCSGDGLRFVVHAVRVDEHESGV